MNISAQLSISYRKRLGSAPLQEVFFPLLQYHSLYFLTDVRNAQYKKAIYILTQNINKYEDIPPVIEMENINFNNIPNYDRNDYINLPFFLNWIVGFTIAEGSFF